MNKYKKQEIIAEYFFIPANNKISAAVIWAFILFGHLCRWNTSQCTVRASEHNGHPPNLNSIAYNPLLPSSIFNINSNWGRVCHIPQPTFMWCGKSRLQFKTEVSKSSRSVLINWVVLRGSYLQSNLAPQHGCPSIWDKMFGLHDLQLFHWLLQSS